MVSDVQESTVVATRLKLRNWLQLRRFFKVNGEVERQLKASPGLVTYSLKADFLRLHFSTPLRVGRRSVRRCIRRLRSTSRSHCRL